MTFIGDPVAGLHAVTGRIVVFAQGTDNALWNLWQTAPNAGWSGAGITWDPLGGSLIPGARLAVFPIPTTSAPLPGTLAVFGRWADNSVRCYEGIGVRSPDPVSAVWGNWFSLGGNISSNPAVGMNHDFRLEVFARNAGDESLGHLLQNPDGSWP